MHASQILCNRNTTYAPDWNHSPPYALLCISERFHWRLGPWKRTGALPQGFAKCGIVIGWIIVHSKCEYHLFRLNPVHAEQVRRGGKYPVVILQASKRLGLTRTVDTRSTSKYFRFRGLKLTVGISLIMVSDLSR